MGVRIASPGVIRLAWSLSLGAWPLAAATVATAPSAPPSRLQIEVSLPLASLQQRVRAAASSRRLADPVEVSRRGPVDIRADLTFTPRPSTLTLGASDNGAGTLSLPVDVRILLHIPDRVKAGIRRDGCGERARYQLKLRFAPRLDQGQLTFVAGAVSAPRAGGYRCRLGTNLIGGVATWITQGKPSVRYDVAAAIERALIAKGEEILPGMVADINRLLPDNAALVALMRAPVRFGSALALGIDGPDVRLTGIRAQGDRLLLSGVLEGFPRIQFGEPQGRPAPIAHAGSDADGFRLPASLLLPTDRALLPDPASASASGWLGDFRLLPVHGRHDVAVLQRRSDGVTRDVVWLSGRARPAPGDVVQRFDQPMADVLKEITDWLADPHLWRGVDGIPALRREVDEFRRLVTHFQQDTTLPLDARGTLHFRGLRVDLRRLWVTAEAILADVELHGRARLQLDLTSVLP